MSYLPGELSMCYEEEHCIEMGNILLEYSNVEVYLGLSLLWIGITILKVRGNFFLMMHGDKNKLNWQSIGPSSLWL
jgi:hypothetical protein